MAEATTQEFELNVEGVGNFVFLKRNFAREFAIQREYARLIDGVKPTEWLSSVGTWMSTLKVLTVKAPDGWVLEELDPLDDATFAKLFKVTEELRAKEDSFRGRTGVAG